MINSLWTSKTGLEGQQTKMDVITNNLANASTNGFKRSRVVFEDLLYQTIRQPGAQDGAGNQLPTGLQVGSGVRVAATERVHTQGPTQQTSGTFDLAITGEGFFTVELPDGTIAYTRDGSFDTNQNGELVMSNGYPVQPAIVVPDNALTITVARDGTVSVTQPGAPGESVQIGEIQLATFINPPGLQSLGENLYIETDASGPPNLLGPGIDGAGLLMQGWVEMSNVNVAEELVEMIQTQRAYELNSKAVSTSDQMLGSLTQL